MTAISVTFYFPEDTSPRAAYAWLKKHLPDPGEGYETHDHPESGQEIVPWFGEGERVLSQAEIEAVRRDYFERQDRRYPE